MVVVKDYLPHGVWKLALIKEFIFGIDGLIRSGRIQLPNKIIISRAMNHLFPLEISSVLSTDCEFSLVDDNDVIPGNSTINYDIERPPKSEAAAKARERISEQIKPDPTYFFLPAGVLQREL